MLDIHQTQQSPSKYSALYINTMIRTFQKSSLGLFWNTVEELYRTELDITLLRETF